MNLLVNQAVLLKGQITPPGSKSHSIRAIMLAAMARGESILKNVLYSDDTQDAIRVCRSLGAHISESENMLTIYSKGIPFLGGDIPEIYSGNSGVTTHFIMPILGLRQSSDRPVILNCGEQMRERPIQSLVAALRNLGLDIQYLQKENSLPICISGKLIGGKTEVDGISSQYLSALLFALPCALRDSEIQVRHLQERPYAEMTLQWLKNQKITFHHKVNDHIDTFQIKGGQSYQPIDTLVSSDFSSASYLIAASALVPGDVTLKGLNMKDTQGDKKLITHLQEMGADIVVEQNHIRIRGGRKLSGIKIDANDIPDLLPVLAVIGTAATGKTEIVNVAHARIKETDRIHSMADGLMRMGAKIQEQQDGLTVYHSQLTGCKVKGFFDHRTVMALSVAGMIAEGETIIEDSQVVSKTYPTFISDMKSIGANMEIENAIIA